MRWGLDGAVCLSLCLGVVPLGRGAWRQQLLILSHYTQVGGLPRRSMVKTCLATPWHMENKLEKEAMIDIWKPNKCKRMVSMASRTFCYIHRDRIDELRDCWCDTVETEYEVFLHPHQHQFFAQCERPKPHPDLCFMLLWSKVCVAGWASWPLGSACCQAWTSFFHFECTATQSWNEQICLSVWNIGLYNFGNVFVFKNLAVAFYCY